MAIDYNDFINEHVEIIERSYKTQIPSENNKNQYTRACWVLGNLNRIPKHLRNDIINKNITVIKLLINHLSGGK